jgi:hypothetical protein
MKYKRCVVLLFFITICRANSGWAASSIPADRKFPTLSVDMGGGCSINVTDYYGGKLASGMVANASYWTDKPPVRSTMEKFAIRFRCMDNVSADDTARRYGGAWAAHEKRWMPYFKSEDDRQIFAPVSKIYQLNSINATGFLTTTDQVNGEESQRVRFYSFCLFHTNKAVCGDGQSMRLEEPKGNYLPYILRVLRSVNLSMTSRASEDLI